jgi:hypothetical protein
MDLRLEQANRYGRDMLALRLTPQAVVEKALTSDHPLQTFLATLDHIGGYKEDPLRKKSQLLALILNNRPEMFMPLRDDEPMKPVVDYHLMRTCLRVGLVDVIDEELRDALVDRQVISAVDEWAVRYAAYRALEQLEALSGVGMAALDAYLFGMRTRCPEMSEPECQLCQLDPVCAKRKELFQPVLRTTLY